MYTGLELGQTLEGKNSVRSSESGRGNQFTSIVII